MSDYILKDGVPVPEPDPWVWAKWFRETNRVLAETEVAEGVRVSTVFIGSGGSGPVPPLLWQTLVFGSPDLEEDQYDTREKAEAGHVRMVERVRAALALPEAPPAV